MLHSQTTMSWTYEPLPGCPATHLDVIRTKSFAASGEQEPRSNIGGIDRAGGSQGYEQCAKRMLTNHWDGGANGGATS
eukprot:2432486-Amphidinium_carterae.1